MNSYVKKKLKRCYLSVAKTNGNWFHLGQTSSLILSDIDLPESLFSFASQFYVSFLELT